MSPASQTQIRDSVMQFLQSNFMFDQKKQVGDDQSLLESGIVDSTGILELIGFLEDTYKVKFQDEELIGENFDTLGKLTSFLMTKIMDAGATKNASA